MFIYKRYIISSIIYTFLIFISIITSTVLIIQIMKFIYLINDKINFIRFIYVIFNMIPYLIHVILPFVSVLVAFYVYHEMNINRKLVVLRFSGLTNFQLSTPLLLVLIFITFIAYIISFYLLPFSYKKLKMNLNFMKNHYMTSIDANQFITISNNITLYFEKRIQDNFMNKIIIFDSTKSNINIMFAKYGKYYNNLNESYLHLMSGVRYCFDKENYFSRLDFSSLIINLDNITFYKDNDINGYYIHDLIVSKNVLCNEKKKKLIIAFHTRIVWPIYNILLPMLLLSLFFNLNYDHRISNLKKNFIIFIPIILSIIFYFIVNNIANYKLFFIFLHYIFILLNFVFISILL